METWIMVFLVTSNMAALNLDTQEFVGIAACENAKSVMLNDKLVSKAYKAGKLIIECVPKTLRSESE